MNLIEIMEIAKEYPYPPIHRKAWGKKSLVPEEIMFLRYFPNTDHFFRCNSIGECLDVPLYQTNSFSQDEVTADDWEIYEDISSLEDYLVPIGEYKDIEHFYFDIKKCPSLSHPSDFLRCFERYLKDKTGKITYTYKEYIYRKQEFYTNEHTDYYRKGAIIEEGTKRLSLNYSGVPSTCIATDIEITKIASKIMNIEFYLELPREQNVKELLT